jgi:hypothetical protein
MKNLAWLAAFALLIGCGDVDTETSVGEETEQQVIDLRSDDGEAHSIEAGSAGVTGGPQIVRRNGERVSFAAWRDRVLDHHQVDMGGEIDEMPFVIIADPNRELDEESAVRQAVGEQRKNQNRCPPGCMHCPEDYGFLCFSMCGGR